MKKSKNKGNHYVNNKEMLEEFVKLKETGKISEKLGDMILKIAKNRLNTYNFIGYTWKDDMMAEAVLTCMKYCRNFDPDKSKNPYGYISKICFNSFREFLKKQKKHSYIKDVLYEKRDFVRDGEDFMYKSIDYAELKQEIYDENTGS